MRPIWEGSLSFGLINIPVKVYSGTAGTEINLDYLHSTDMSPIRYARICREDGKEIPYEDIVRGYEYRKGDYVVLTGEDFKNVDLKKTASIDVFSFVDSGEIDPMYSEKPYFLEPAEGSAKAYAVLREALKKSGKVALGKFVLREHEHVYMIKPKDHLLLMDELRYSDEIAKPTGLNIPDTEVRGKEVDMAIELIDKLSGRFEPEKYKDTYKVELEKVIQAKEKGRRILPKGKAPTPTKTTDLMATLRASLAKSRHATATA